MAYLQRKLSYLDPKIVAFDINNPRGEAANQITSDKDFERLVKSIKEYGVLEPLIVRKNGKQGKDYILVDGERRLRAANKVKLIEVPTLIAADEINGRILAYQVHKLRKDWSKTTETKSIKIIIEEIKENNPAISGRDLKKKVLEITNSSEHEIADIMRLIKYDEKMIEMVLDQDNKLKLSHLVQIDSSFVTKIKKHYPEILEKYDEHNIRRILAVKASKKLLGLTTRYFADTFKEVFESETHHEEIRGLLLGFLRRKSEDIRDTYEKFQAITQGTSDEGKEGKKKKKARKKKMQKKRVSVPEEIDNIREIRQYEGKLIENQVFDILFHYMKGAIQEFEKRTNNVFKDEPELQNFVFSVLRCLFASVEFEDPTEKMCGTFTRKDFVIKDHKIIIETKYVHKSGDQKKIANELSIDYPRYKNCEYGETIINYIYDPKGYITNHSQYRKELKKLLPEAHHYIQ